jgi:hypothetical protein
VTVRDKSVTVTKWQSSFDFRLSLPTRRACPLDGPQRQKRINFSTVPVGWEGGVRVKVCGRFDAMMLAY